MAKTFRLERPNGIALTLTDRGATWLSCEVPMPDGQRRSVILQRAGIEDASADSAYLGATVGRYANRIAQARIRRGGDEWALAPTPGSPHQLHGGLGGFHSRTWDVTHLDDSGASFSLVSQDGDQGFPGELDVTVTYRLLDELTIEMETLATVSAPSPVAVTNHAYFNLDGAIGDARDHSLSIKASRYMPVDHELIPLNGLENVQGTSFDFRSSKPIRSHWLTDEQQRFGAGYDHAFLLDATCADMREPAVQLVSSAGDLSLEISTTLPALQFYAGQYLGGVSTPGGHPYPACAGVALEAGFLPDSPNHPEWPQPSCWLLPGQPYRHVIRYGFRGDPNHRNSIARSSSGSIGFLR